MAWYWSAGMEEGLLVRYTDTQMDIQIDRQIDGQTYRQIDMDMDNGRTVSQVNRHIDGYIDRQTLC